MNVRLTENGFAKADICFPPGSGRVVRFAARELAKYLYAVNRSAFKILEKKKCAPGMVFISAGNDDNSDAFELKSGRGAVEIRGANPRAALFGVYELLERIGCRFADPYKEFVPEQLTIDVPEGAEEIIPAFYERVIYYTPTLYEKIYHFDGFEPARILPQIDYMAKRKLSTFVMSVDFGRYDLWDTSKHLVLEALRDRGLKIELANRSIEYFCPPSDLRDFGGYGPATYEITRPNWYANGILKIDHSEVKAVIIRRYLAFLKAHPELNAVALAPSKESLKYQPAKGVSIADAYMQFFDEAAAAVRKAFPGKKLKVLLQAELLDAPAKPPAAGNIVYCFEASGVNYHYALADKANAPVLKKLKKYYARMPKGSVICVDNVGCQPPLTPLSGVIRANLKRYLATGARGAYITPWRTLNLVGQGSVWSLEFFVFSNLAWKPNADISALKTKWAEGVYETAAGSIVGFVDCLENAHQAEAEFDLAATGNWIDLELLHAAQAKLGEARAAASDDLIVKKIDALEASVAHACTFKIVHGAPALEDEFVR